MTDKSLLDDADTKSLLDVKKVDCTIYLMRHGHTVLDVDKRSDGFLDFPLSDAGRLGVIDAQQHLKLIPITCIYCPDLKRAHETAHIVQSGTMSEPPIETVPEARTWDLGVLAGTRKRYGRPEVQKLIDNPNRAPMDGESFNDFRKRFMKWFKGVQVEAAKAGPVLFVGSGSNLRLISQELLGDADVFDLDEGGLAALHKSAGSWHGEVILGEDDHGDQVS